eukprot:m.3709 g.3709  ORF g.3709 m.3709 type:complete len:672 (+) comp2815_c0_seq1:217-2232(+)
MASEEELAKLEAHVTEQGAVVRDLKKKRAPKDEIDAAVKILLERKKKLEDAKPKEWDRTPFEDLLKRRFVVAPSFEIYGGVAGLYDYGPTGCNIKTNMINLWREHFVIRDNMFEIDCPAMTPEMVLKASGHVDRFADIMTRDAKTGECIRADHLLEDVMEARMKDMKLTAEEREEAKLIHARADDYDKKDLQELFKKFQIKSYAGNELSEPEDFNMMFETHIGPSGQLKGFLRPETAQGIFLAFKRLYEFNNARLPFAGAQIGVAYRNEISPRSGLLRVREFQMAEIEHFLDPEDKSCAKFKQVADIVLPLLPRENQLSGKPPVKKTIGEAVKEGMIDNETLGYFIGRIYLFLERIGVDMQRLRFRQHLANEMAHYACDCWDAELNTSYGWIECVGCADRSAYDLEAHTKGSSIDLKAAVKLKEPVQEEVISVVPNKKKLGPALKKEAGVVSKYLASLSNEQATEIGNVLEKEGAAKITIEGKEYELGPDLISVSKKVVTRHERKFTPSVIEPSFGIGRILYCLLEHVYDVREGDEQRGFLKLPPAIAPVKVALLPLSSGQSEFDAPIAFLEEKLADAGLSCRVDNSTAQIGRRYARTDEIAVPFAVTVDFDTKTDNTVTLRERDSMQQIRLKIEEIPDLVSKLASGQFKWKQAVEQYGLTETGAGDGADK